MRSSSFGAVVAAVCWVLGLRTLAGQELTRSTRIVADNDYFNFWAPPDRRPDDNYTQGLRVSWDAARVPSRGRRLVCRAAAGCGTSFDVGQEMYTPTNDASTPLPGERPFAGWLYGRFTVRAGDSTKIRNLGVTLGVTGPVSFAEGVQVGFHRRIPGFRRPLGWDYQLANEVAFALRAQRAWRLAPSSGLSEAADLIPSIDGHLGTLRTSLGAGLKSRIGVGLGHPWLATNRRPASFSLFAEARGEVVVHDLFLDGNTFRSSVRVRRRPFVPEGAWGAAMRVRRIAVEYRAVSRGQEYQAGPRVHRYGSVLMRWVVR